MSCRLLRFHHKHPLAISRGFSEIEVHSEGCNPYVMVMARFHQMGWFDKPGIAGQAVYMDCCYPAYTLSAFFHNKLHHARHAWEFVNIQRSAHRLIIGNNFYVASAAHIAEVFKKLVCLHFKAVNVLLHLDNA